MSSKPKASRIAASALALLALVLTPTLADYDAGMQYWKSGDYVKSASEWEAVVANAPDYAFGYAMLGNCYLKLKKPRDAEPQFRKAIEIDPGKFDYHANLAKTLLSLRKYDEVVVVLDQAESLATSQRQMLVLAKMRGLSLNQVKDYGRAVQDLRRANPEKDHQVASGLALACYATNDYECLKKATAQAMALKSGDAKTLTLMVRAALDKARRTAHKGNKRAFYAEAEPHAAKLVKIAKDKVGAHELYGAALLGTKKFTQGIGQFQAVLGIEPNNCNAMLNIATANQELEKWDELLKWANKAAKCDPTSDLAFSQQALGHNKKKEWDKAIAAAEKALAIKNNNRFAVEMKKIAQDGKAADEHNEAVLRDKEEYERQLALQRQQEEEDRKKREQWEGMTGGGGEKKKEEKK